MRHTYKLKTQSIESPGAITEWILRPRNADERKRDTGYEMIKTDETAIPVNGYPIVDLGYDLTRQLSDRGEQLYMLDY